MHIADGFLSPAVCAGTGVIAAGALGLSLRRLEQSVSVRTIPLTGMLAALIFAGQMVKFPLLVTPAYGHLLGGVLAAVVAGPWAGCVALALVLFLQMALFADGGWMAYGANVLNMGVVGSMGGYAVYAAVRRRIGGERGVIIGAVVASWISVVAASALFCLEFALSHPASEFDLPKIVALMTSLHSLIGVGEALITGGIVLYVVAQRPDLVLQPQPSPGAGAGVGRLVWGGAVAALLVAAFLAPFASEGADGLEAVAQATAIDQLESPAKVLLLEEYALPLPGVDLSRSVWQRVSVALAGVFGTGCVLGLAWMFGRWSRPHEQASEAAGHGG
ncbi:MAG: energy-coupling factor ABC transporter permease [Planctomycetales bacterium]